MDVHAYLPSLDPNAGKLSQIDNSVFLPGSFTVQLGPMYHLKPFDGNNVCNW